MQYYVCGFSFVFVLCIAIVSSAGSNVRLEARLFCHAISAAMLVVCNWHPHGSISIWTCEC